jgi:hypothetical protein
MASMAEFPSFSSLPIAAATRISPLLPQRPRRASVGLADIIARTLRLRECRDLDRIYKKRPWSLSISMPADGMMAARSPDGDIGTSRPSGAAFFSLSHFMRVR